MEGLQRRPQPPLDVRREFVGSRLEEQILVRTYELIVPIIRRRFEAEQPTTAETHSSQRLKKGA